MCVCMLVCWCAGVDVWVCACGGVRVCVSVRQCVRECGSEPLHMQRMRVCLRAWRRACGGMCMVEEADVSV